jgi:hypothetical protein
MVIKFMEVRRSYGALPTAETMPLQDISEKYVQIIVFKKIFPLFEQDFQFRVAEHVTVSAIPTYI